MTDKQDIHAELMARVDWYADTSRVPSRPTPLIAAMRCYVASKLGDEVDVPEELA